MAKIKFFDATLRDGNHAVKHQLTAQNVEDYCQAIDRAGMDTIIVGHGNGLGASSLQVGLALLSDKEMLTCARKNLIKTKLGAYLIPGFGTIHTDIEPALACGVEVFKVGCHCTEADTTKQHIEYIRNAGKEAYGVLMMYHMTDTSRLLIEAQKMQAYGANGIILMDSAGASTMELVKKTVATLHDGLNVQVGFHSHNNLGLAVANAYIAIQQGATIIDGTLRGFGAGAGNCQLEALIALLLKNDYELPGVDWYKLLDASENVVRDFMAEDRALSSLSIVSGTAGVFSSFKLHVERAAQRFNVDPRDIFIELGKRKIVGGQEDMIVEVAAELQNQNAVNQSISF
ncbi:MAG: 4-hydroxy-2-oxovalerate aldolase [Oscillospiraceae bacterium]|nr:4-hydroxy-2-oxovalerate aldolase [Oscillospiraceae bacterium]